MYYKINTQFMKYSTEDELSLLLSDLEAHKHQIDTLDLSLNTYTPSVFPQIAEKIKEMTNLKHIVLESILDSLNYEEMCSVIISLSECLPKNLVSLDIPSNALSWKYPIEFSNFLSLSTLKVLNLHNCGLGEIGLEKITECLEKIENKKNLISLDLSKNRINVIHKEFTEVLSRFSNLQKLILNGNTIEEDSMSDFFYALKNEKIEILNLTDNFVCGKAIKNLSKFFLKNPIKELYLQDIKVDKGDINILLENMKEKHFNALPGALQEKMELTLDISCNYFDQNCIQILEELSEIFLFDKLIIFENNYEDCSNLKKLITEDNGQLIEEEEEEDEEAVDEGLLEMVSKILK